MKISRTPLRFSLIGGGSDLPAYWRKYGPCKIISMTLTASMYVTYTERNYGASAKDAYGHNIRVSYTRTENVDTIDDIQHELVRATLASLELEYPAFEITTIGDVPSMGAGLGSSSALIVGLLKLFSDMSNLNIAHWAAIIETDKLGKRIGWQDHLSASFGGLRQYRLWDDEGHNDFDEALIGRRGGCGYDLAEHLLAFRLPANRSEASESLPMHDNLVDMEKAMEERAKYLKETVDMVDDMVGALAKRNFGEVGNIMQRAWHLKKASHGFLDKNIERWYALGMDSGALAGKVSGSMSKGAGHLFFLAYPDAHDRIRKALTPELAELNVEYYPYGSKVWEI